MRIDEEFRALIPPLSSEEFEQLEQNCLRDGIRDSLVVWDDNGEFVLIDGHNRYEIAMKHNLPYSHRRMEFPNREAATKWIILNQFGRRNLSAYDRSILALKLKPMIAEKAKEKQTTHTEQGYQKSDKAEHTAKELAKIAGVSHDTIHKVETIEKKAPAEIKQKVKAGELSINQGYRQTVNNLVKPADIIKEAKEQHKQFQEAKQDNIVSFQDIQQDTVNKEILAIDLYKEICNATNQIDKLSLLKNEDDYDMLWNNLDRESYGDLYTRLTSSKRIISNLMEELERRRNG